MAMDSEAILPFNFPNWITVTIMAIIAFAFLAFGTSLWAKKQGAATS